MNDRKTLYYRTMNYYETDQMGIIHHSNYIRLFEEARLDMMEQFGLDYRKMEEEDIIIPVMSVECRYLVPLRYKDEIEIYTAITRFDGIKMEVAYEIYRRGTQTLCTTGHTGHCFLDGSMKPFRMKKKYPDLYHKLQALVQ